MAPATRIFAAALASFFLTVDAKPKGNLATVHYSSKGVQRKYHLFSPHLRKNESHVCLPLMVLMHGWQETCEHVAPNCVGGWCDIDALAASRGYYVASACGLENSWSAGTCCEPSSDKKVHDVAAMKALVAEVSANVCIDDRRVYAVGFSNGAMLANRLACEAPDVFRGVASISGTIALNNKTADGKASLDACKSKHDAVVKKAIKDKGFQLGFGTSVLTVHGSGDIHIPEAGHPFAAYPSVEDVMETWATLADCSDITEVEWRHDGVSNKKWQKCSNKTVVELVTVEDGGHEWFSGALTSKSDSDGISTHTSNFDTTDYIFDFFDLAAKRQYGIKPQKPKQVDIYGSRKLLREFITGASNADAAKTKQQTKDDAFDDVSDEELDAEFQAFMAPKSAKLPSPIPPTGSEYIKTIHIPSFVDDGEAAPWSTAGLDFESDEGKLRANLRDHKFEPDPVYEAAINAKGEPSLTASAEGKKSGKKDDELGTDDLLAEMEELGSLLVQFQEAAAGAKKDPAESEEGLVE